MKTKHLFLIFLLATGCKATPEGLLSEFIPEGKPPLEETTQTSSQASDSLSCEEARFVTLLNFYRKQNSLAQVSVAESGVEGARWMAEDMMENNYFSHTDSLGRPFYERAISFGYPAWAENIAAGNTTASATFCQWKNSSGHNRSMLDAKHRTIGIGNRSSGGTYKTYWVNTFGPEVNDKLSAPLTKSTCSMPTALPSC